MSLFRRLRSLPSLPASLTLARLGRPPSPPSPLPSPPPGAPSGRRVRLQSSPALTRRGLPQPAFGQDSREARAAQDVQGSLAERIVVQELRRRRISFIFDNVLYGEEGGAMGGMEQPGFDTTFYLPTLIPPVGLDVLGETTRKGEFLGQWDEIRAFWVEARGGRYEVLWEGEVTGEGVEGAERLEERMDEIIGRPALMSRTGIG